MRRLDEVAIREFAIPGILLMENAGRGAALAALGMRRSEGPVVILCGKGNNGGDGFVIARHLHNHGVPVRVYFVGDLGSVGVDSDPGVNLEILRRMGIAVLPLVSLEVLEAARESWREPSLIVDALLGTGISGPVRSPIAEMIGALNGWGHAVLAVDTPSGLDCDTGEVLGVAVRATRTITFGLPKWGFSRSAGPECVGQVEVVNISLPRELIEREVGP